jgi:hypothetical protein
MEVSMDQQQHPPSPMRLLGILTDRFGALVAVANSSIKLAHYAPEDELAIDLLVAESVLEFGSSLREARDEAMEWAQARGVAPLCVRIARQPQEVCGCRDVFQRPNGSRVRGAGPAHNAVVHPNHGQPHVPCI